MNYKPVDKPENQLARNLKQFSYGSDNFSMGIFGSVGHDTAKFSAIMHVEGTQKLSDIRVTLGDYPEKAGKYTLQSISFSKVIANGQYVKPRTITDTALLNNPQAIDPGDKSRYTLGYNFISPGAKHYSHKMQVNFTATMINSDSKTEKLKQVMVFKRVLHINLGGN